MEDEEDFPEELQHFFGAAALLFEEGWDLDIAIRVVLDAWEAVAEDGDDLCESCKNAEKSHLN